MKLLPGTIAGALALLGLAAGSAANAADGASAWGAWSNRAQAIDDGLSASDGAAVSRACGGVPAMLTSQGAVFPDWAQGLTTLCHVTDTIAKMQATGDEKKAWCSDLKDAADRLGQAKPVVGEPRAAKIALELSAISRSVYEKTCR